VCATYSLLNETNGNKLLCLLGRRETEGGSWSVVKDLRVNIVYILRSEINNNLRIIAHIYFFCKANHLLCYPAPEEGMPKINFEFAEERVDP
jgi:hypothetical protein